MSTFDDTVLESNRQGRDGWSRFAPHRARLHALLEAAEPRGSLCVLGAGNLNDLRLPALLDTFGRITLVDLDTTTVHAALAGWGLASHPRCTVCGPIELTGIHARLPRTPAPDGAADALVAALAAYRFHVPGEPFDVTISTGVLTQMLQSVADSALAGPDAARVAVGIRDRHLHDLTRLTAPGGTLVLVTDVVSTLTAPVLARIPASELEPAMAALVAAGNFFTGTNPYRIRAVLEEDPCLRERVTRARLADPWLWAVTPDRAHLTCAIVANRAWRPHPQA